MSWVYVVQAQNGNIKVGVSGNPAKRVQSISLNSPIPCRLIAVLPGKRCDELAIHNRLAEARRHSEWFGSDHPLVHQFCIEVWGKGLASVMSWDEYTLAAQIDRRAEGAKRRAEKHRELWRDPKYREMQARWRERRKADRPRPTPTASEAA